ncbi:hypothetical protein B0H16DRAFT_1749490 [Mycena metata]|uniref:Zinc finger C3HC4 RING-type domain-containing protein n=1 Tax=Mycena metata TaxID=1033252 RepID=A0AAD7GND6_9AGAR|nr:hypothetical protein B0H16DRAFT_1749490 [Mycena metata]
MSPRVISLAPKKHTCQGHVPCLLYNKSAADMQRIRDALGISSANTTVRSAIKRDRLHRGSRVIRDVPLTEDDLYLSADRPPTLKTDRAHQTCSICLNVKAHPVAYLCGHSHCYVCIRIHLEEDWSPAVANSCAVRPTATTPRSKASRSTLPTGMAEAR